MQLRPDVQTFVDVGPMPWPLDSSLTRTHTPVYALLIIYLAPITFAFERSQGSARTPEVGPVLLR